MSSIEKQIEAGYKPIYIYDCVRKHWVINVIVSLQNVSENTWTNHSNKLYIPDSPQNSNLLIK